MAVGALEYRYKYRRPVPAEAWKIKMENNKKCFRFGCGEAAVAEYADKKSTVYLDPVCAKHQYVVAHIKGLCENCGFAYEGDVRMKEGKYFPLIKCPTCNKETQNFDNAADVEAQMKAEGEAEPAYVHVDRFEEIG